MFALGMQAWVKWNKFTLQQGSNLMHIDYWGDEKF